MTAAVKKKSLSCVVFSVVLFFSPSSRLEWIGLCWCSYVSCNSDDAAPKHRGSGHDQDGLRKGPQVMIYRESIRQAFPDILTACRRLNLQISGIYSEPYYPQCEAYPPWAHALKFWSDMPNPTFRTCVYDASCFALLLRRTNIDFE